jgi:hypothetical protein
MQGSHELLDFRAPDCGVVPPITYRDFANNWFQTDVTLERDVEKSGGLRLGWTQEQIPDPTSDTDS